MHSSSPAFGEGKPIPTKFAYQGVTGGKNISLPVTWDDVPKETQSFALSMVDPHPVAANFIHWLVINIPGDVHALREGASPGAMPPGSRELYNSYGKPGYGGPEPPKGTGPHPYVTTIFALDVASVDLGANSSLNAFNSIINKHLLGSAKFTGLYER
jgi:Raf kinase inhibitor-like YbhB/YbcL family protein